MFISYRYFEKTFEINKLFKFTNTTDCFLMNKSKNLKKTKTKSVYCRMC